MIAEVWLTKLYEALEESGLENLALLLHVLNYDTEKQCLCATGFSNSGEVINVLTRAIATVNSTEPVRTERKLSTA